MEKQVVQSKPLTQVISILNMQTRLFKNVIGGLDSNSTERLAESTNHVAWLAGHLVSTRHFMAALAGHPIPEPHPELFAQGKGLDPEANYPSLEKCAADWDAISSKVIEGLGQLPEAALSEKGPFATPMGESLGEIIGFLTHHEAYHIGQLGILRKYFGQEGMKYS